MFSVNQISDTEWEVLDGQGARIGALHATYAEALGFIGGMLAVGRDLASTLAEDDAEDQATGTGVLPETWVDVAGICMSQPTGDGRDFTGCEWSSRDPAVSLMPLMLQTTTEFGHMGAVLAGFFETIELGDTPHASGRFYDSDAGRQLRDMLLDGRSFGVSVDPGRVSVEWICSAEDEDGWCIEETASFTEYEIIGQTATPFPAFAEARITLGAAAAEPAAAASVATTVAASARTRGVDLARPPEDWFLTPEPVMGEPFVLGSLGDEWLVDQGQGRLAMPLHISDDGRLLGHLAVDGQCHIGYPGMCVTPPRSANGYAGFMVGEVVTATGRRVATGALSAGCDHALATLRAPEARDHYAHNGIAWADVRVIDGEHGPWVCGALRPGVTEDQLRILRAGALSGDWRREGTNLELIAALAVTTPGFPIARQAIMASGLMVAEPPRQRAVVADGVQMSLVASGIVRRCPDCARRAAEAAVQHQQGGSNPRVVQLLEVLERRTRHLVPEAARHAAARLTRQ